MGQPCFPEAPFRGSAFDAIRSDASPTLVRGGASVFFRQMKLKTASKFTYRLGTGLNAGADLVRLLQSEATMGPAPQRAAMQKLVDGVKKGDQLSAIMSGDPYFPRMMAAMTRVGEETGKLERSMLTLSEHFQHQIATRRWFINSITWPALQLVAAIGVISLLILIMGMFDMADVLGLGLKGGSGVLWFWFYIAVVFGILGLMVWAFFRNVAGVQNLIPLVYKVPLIGPAVQTITLAKFCWTLSLSLGAGIDPIRSIQLSLDSTDSDYYRSGADDAEKAIRGGATLSGALGATGIFPDDFLQRIDIAEHSGTDAESIDYLTKEYDERSKQAIRVIAGVFTVLIRVSVMGILIFFIFRLFSTYINAINSASDPIVPPRFGN